MRVFAVVRKIFFYLLRFFLYITLSHGKAHRHFTIFLYQSEQQKITYGGCMEEPNDFFTKTFIVNDKAKEQIVRLGKIEEYDEAGRLVHVTNFSSHGEKEFYEVFREYDELGNLIHSMVVGIRQEWQKNPLLAERITDGGTLEIR